MRNTSAASSPVLGAVRWVIFLPAALLAGALARLVIYWVNFWMFRIMGMNPYSFWSSLMLEGLPYAAMGAAIVFVAARIAPSRKKAVVFGTAILSVLVAGSTLFIGVAARDGWTIYSALAQVAGTAAIGWSVYSGEVSDERLGDR